MVTKNPAGPALAIVTLLLFTGCARGDKALAGETAAPPLASVTTTASATAATSVASVPSATATATAQHVAEPAPLPPLMPARRVSPLADVGLSIAPPFPYRLEDRKTHWDLEDTSRKAGTVWVMRKMFTANAPLGQVVPCADPKEGAPHAEPDGSFTYRCKGSAKDDGTWFARLVPTTNKTYETVQCQGSSTSPERLKLIEATCRSIKKG